MHIHIFGMENDNRCLRAYVHSSLFDFGSNCRTNGNKLAGITFQCDLNRFRMIDDYIVLNNLIADAILIPLIPK